MRAPFGDYQPKRSPDTILDYRPRLAGAIDVLPAATLDRLPELLRALAERRAVAKRNPGSWQPGNPILGGDPRQYRPSDDELLVSELGARIAAVVAKSPPLRVERVLARARIRARQIEFGRIAIRHVDAMGSGRFFYASAPELRRVTLPGPHDAVHVRRIAAALVTAGVPRALARVIRRGASKPAPLCSYRHEPTTTTTVVHAITRRRGAAPDGYLVIEERDGARVNEVPLVTARAGEVALRLMRAGFKEVRGSMPPAAAMIYERKGVRFTRYRHWPLVGDVASALRRCTGISQAELQRRFAVLVASASR